MAISFISLALGVTNFLVHPRRHGNKLQHNEGEARKMYERWLLDNEKNYNGPGEKERRFMVFKDNLKLIETHNLVSNRTYELGLNQFADLTDDEYQSIYLGGKVERTSLSLEWEWDTSNRYRYKEAVPAL
ncbi:Papain-like cysteine peptidase superfamily [Arabidopsis thaliana x Arabidopsis arenosa]|uniref:Papain-like cysteine peptidase superfamily n=1 Tax=Arabidopsis thaliana x Arabidopsis arenosa TaxID=1240361 RepID=A0A8T1ZK99_9BRAS|nr:Papain-like cysteine peptidase superfamily [Arabidopsis thaliana x Arabidopsis arenosa]